MYSDDQSAQQRVNCMKCAHFYVTWDPRHPRGCRAYQFKSVQLPSVVVRASSGCECMQFTPKDGRAARR
jgi:hypothetical protein